MSLSNQLETSILALLFTNIAIADIGDVAGLLPSADPGDFFLALHTAAMADTDTSQVTNEATYTSYARKSVARSVSEWTVTGNTVDNDNEIAFVQATGGSNTITDVTIGEVVSGASNINIYGAIVGGSLAVSNGITPRFAAGALQVTAD